MSALGPRHRWRTIEERDAAREMRSRRLARCACCGLLTSQCVGDAERIAVATRVVLVVHRIEARKTTNTGLLAARLLTPFDVCLRGEREREATERVAVPTGRRLVLFPAPDARFLTPRDAPAHAGPLTLVVPDGSWSQARKVLRREPFAAGAEPVRLPAGAKSRYLLRRAPREDGVCTFEAIARALGVLEGPETERALMEHFDRFVARALEVRGRRGADHTRADEV